VRKKIAYTRGSLSLSLSLSPLLEKKVRGEVGGSQTLVGSNHPSLPYRAICTNHPPYPIEQTIPTTCPTLSGRTAPTACHIEPTAPPCPIGPTRTNHPPYPIGPEPFQPPCGPDAFQPPRPTLSGRCTPTIQRTLLSRCVPYRPAIRVMSPGPLHPLFIARTSYDSNKTISTFFWLF
jgi:hypothetical protein